MEEGFYGGSCNSVRCCCIADENAIFDHSFNFFWLAFFRLLFLCAQSPSRTSNFYYQFWTCFASMRLSVWQLLFCLFLFCIILFTCWIVLGCVVSSLGILLAFWGGLVGWLVGWVGLFVTPFEERDNHIVVTFFSPKERARCSELLAYGPVGGCLGGTHGVLMGRGENFC